MIALVNDGNRVSGSLHNEELLVLLTLLKQKLEEIVDKKEDSLRFYHLCQNCIPKSFEICNKVDIFEQEELFI